MNYIVVTLFMIFELAQAFTENRWQRTANLLTPRNHRLMSIESRNHFQHHHHHHQWQQQYEFEFQHHHHQYHHHNHHHQNLGPNYWPSHTWLPTSNHIPSYTHSHYHHGPLPFGGRFSHLSTHNTHQNSLFHRPWGSRNTFSYRKVLPKIPERNESCGTTACPLTPISGKNTSCTGSQTSTSFSSGSSKNVSCCKLKLSNSPSQDNDVLKPSDSSKNSSCCKLQTTTASPRKTHYDFGPWGSKDQSWFDRPWGNKEGYTRPTGIYPSDRDSWVNGPWGNREGHTRPTGVYPSDHDHDHDHKKPHHCNHHRHPKPDKEPLKPGSPTKSPSCCGSRGSKNDYDRPPSPCGRETHGHQDEDKKDDTGCLSGLKSKWDAFKKFFQKKSETTTTTERNPCGDMQYIKIPK